MSKNYLIYPCKTMRITQSYTGKTSHLPYSTGTPKDFPVDEGCNDTGRDWCYCPCDEMIVKRIYGVNTNGVNSIFLESTSKVCLANGTTGYFSWLIIHPNDDDLKKIKVGQKFKRKEKICREGNDGCTSNHFHFSVGKGKIKGNGWTKNNKGKYVLTVTDKAYKPEKAFYIDSSFTEVVDDKGLNFKKLPVYTTGTYKINSVTLKVRCGAGVENKAIGTLFKGKKITVEKVDGIWGEYAKGKWVSLKHCKKIKD